MNTRILQENIREKLRFLKAAQTRISGAVSKFVADSTVAVSADAVFAAHKNSVLKKIFETVYSVPKWAFHGKKTKSVAIKNFSKTVGIYPNKSVLRLVNSTTINRYQTQLVLVDSNNKAYDVRTRGGGYSKTYIENVLSSSIFLGSYADIGYWDGLPLAASGSITIELPEDIKTKYKESYITDILKRYSASGLYPVVLYYPASDVEQYGWNLDGSENA